MLTWTYPIEYFNALGRTAALHLIEKLILIPLPDPTQQQLNGINNGVVKARSGNAVTSEVVRSKPFPQELSQSSELISDDEVIEDDESEDVDFDEAFGDWLAYWK